jgi:hypothetical protein
MGKKRKMKEMISLVEIKVVSVCFEWMKINLTVEQQKSVIDKEMQERGWNEKECRR